jgi:AcrR family transcriptional regulator
MPIEFSGRGDPMISIQLLWGRQKRPTRGPKPALSVERVVRAGIEVADAEGLEALSMRRVAQQLGVGTMSLYRHVPAKGELLDLMLDTVLGEEPAADASGGWRAQLEQWARSGLALYRRHPWVLHISTIRPPLGPNTIGSWDRMLQAVTGIGLSSAEMVAATTALGGYVRGAALDVVERSQVERSTGESEESWWSARQGFWEDYFDEERFPGISHVWHDGGFDAPLDPFEFGLARVLDGIEAYVNRSGSNGAGSTTGDSPA